MDARPFYAHSDPNSQDTNTWELLKDHLGKSSQKARTLAEDARPGDHALAKSAEIAGILHDLGKYQLAWQSYLEKAAAELPAKSVPHAIFGALFAGHVLKNDGLLWAIAGHHAGLRDCDHFQKFDSDPSVHPEVLKALELAQEGTKDGLGFPSELSYPFEVDSENVEDCRRYEFWARMLFSILVDADRLETEFFATKKKRPQVLLDPNSLLKRLEQARKEKAGEKSDTLTRLRNEVFEACRVAGENRHQGFFALTVPTGGAKTLAAMAFALAHARKHRLRRVIVVLPYLSIIEQNAKEYRDILGSSQILEHHSAREVANKPNLGEEAQRTWEELAAENWEAPIIVTTSVQFLESLLAASTRRCRKLHNIARSVVIFDEVQTMPTHLLEPLWSIFRELIKHWGVSLVLSTATQPAFRQSPGLKEGLRPKELDSILGDSLEKELFLNLRRVRYKSHLSETWDWPTLANRLKNQSQGLCVLNIRAHARAVWVELKSTVDPALDKAVIHLSSAMCAQHRSDVLGDKNNPAPESVRGRLRGKLPCWLVSTQVVEAGVDISFPVVFRALGPLDSIVQVAGRCNREGELGFGEFGLCHIFSPSEKGLPKGVYQVATGLAKTFLTEYSEEAIATDRTLFSIYFNELFQKVATDHEVHGENTIQQDRAAFNFARVAERGIVIKDGGVGVIVPYKASTRWIKKVRSSKRFSVKTLRRFQRYMVNLRQSDFNDLQQLGMLSELLPGESVWVLDENCYHENLGVVIRDRSPDDFVQ